ncbi:hypothetical protein, partial [Chitinimonas sp.]|uniref:hypothetical protein n=1 Tax=Chitinimonas sp. TaxID=1934313 RepID=UPI0035B3BBB5
VMNVMEFDAVNLTTSQPETLRVSDGKGFRTRPTDPVPNAMVRGRLMQPYLLRRDLFEKATTFGGVGMAKGEVLLQNADGQLDYLLGYAFDGRQGRAWQGEDGAPFPGAWSRIGVCVVDTVSFDTDKVRLALRDDLQTLNKPLLPNRFAGNNVLPAGLEGVADLKDKPKPRLYGSVMNIAPKQVNTSKSIYQISDKACAVSAVFDRGIVLALDAVASSKADLEATVPAASSYRLWSGPDGTYVRLGTQAKGTVTVDASTTETRAASLLQQIAGEMGLSAYAPDVAALNAANSAAVGIWVDGDTTALTAMNELASAVAASFYIDNLGRLRMARLEAPAGPPVMTISSRMLIELALISTADSDKGVPPWQVRLGYARNYTVQNDLAGGAGARVSWAAADYRRLTVDDTGVKTLHPNSEPMQVDTCLVNQADAQAEAQRRLNLYKVGRQMFQIKAEFSPAQLAALDLNQCVLLKHVRFGLTAGRLLRVVGMELNAELGEATLRLWG